MADTLRDLASWYPITAQEGKIPEIVPHILDVRVCITLDASDLKAQIDKLEGKNVFSVTLSNITPNICSVHCESPLDLPSDFIDFTIPVYIGRDILPNTGRSYLILDEELTYDSELKLHPDCVIFEQKAPTISLRTRDTVSFVDSYEVDGFVGNARTYTYKNKLSFNDGHNVTVAFKDNTVIFNALSGAGLGLYREPPFVEPNLSYAQKIYGLTSINGFYPEITIKGYKNINVAASAPKTGTQVKLTIGSNTKL